MANIWDSAANYTPSTTWPSGAGGGTGGPSGNPYYNGGQYGQNQDWYNSPIGQNIREDNQQLAFQTQFPRVQQAYGMATMDNPMLTIDQFLATMPQQQQLMQEYAALSPRARGAEYSTFAPNARWIPR